MTQGQQESKGDVSDWNEGNFKSMRLHNAQNLINGAKMYPLRILSLDVNDATKKKWGYEYWFDGVNIMFGEGQQLYNNVEFKEVSAFKKELEKLMQISFCKLNGSGIQFDVLKWNAVKEKLEEFEYSVKHYNSKHGLATKIAGTKGLF